MTEPHRVLVVEDDTEIRETMIEVLEEATIVEVKNGPYIEGADKGRFAATRPRP